MAAIDKIYLESWEEYSQFRDWCKNQPLLVDKYGKRESITHYLYPWKEGDWKKHEKDCKPVFMAPYYIDAYVIRNCSFEFVQKELMVNYGHWSQERIKSFYDDVINWDNSKGECPYWAKKEDFIFHEDGTIELKGLEESDYSKILKGELYNFPSSAEYEVGTHFKCIKHPKYMFNRPFMCKSWFIDVETPDGMPWMWYHSETNTWDFSDEYVICKWTSSTAHIKTIKALHRHMRKWKLPVGTIVRATGRYRFDDYEFRIVN